MTACMTLAQFGINTIGDWLVYPTSCDYYFYAKILAGLFLLLTLSIFYTEKKILIKPDIISSLGVSSLVILFLAMIGTLITSSSGIPMIQQDIFIYVIAFTVIFVAMWFFKD